MKVIFAVILVAASASAIGSGPYLPSGWKPTGPAFYLPSEINNPSENPLKDTILQESVSSGSDFLREYGPPNVQDVSQDLTKQYLPEVETEQAFIVIEAKLDQEEVNTEVETKSEIKEENLTVSFEEVVTEKVVDSVTEGNEELKSTVTEEIVFDISTEISNEQPTIIGKSLNIEAPVEETDTKVQEVNEFTQKIVAGEETENSNSDFVSSIEERVEVQRDNVAEVKNIAEALTNLENEINSQQVQSDQEVIDGKTVDESAGSLQNVPEGFLEYGPPGFREYGPPKENEPLSKTAEEASRNNLSDNDIRKRRFSPKFRSEKRTH